MAEYIMKRRKSKNISGPRIALIRRRKHLTQTDLAKLVRKAGINLDRAAIAKIENGLRCVYDYELVTIAQVLKVSTSKLVV
mgnify:CR=1 FL=1